MSERWKELGVVAAGGFSKNATVCRVTERDGELSFEYGVKRGARIEARRHWRGANNLSLAMLAKFAVELEFLATVHPPKSIDAEWLESRVRLMAGMLCMAPDVLPPAKPVKVGTNLGDVMRGKS